MGCVIDTGQVVQASNSHCATSVAGIDTSPNDRVIYPTNDRPLILVKQGQMAIITGYNLLPQTKVIFRKVLCSSGSDIVDIGSNCCPRVSHLVATRLCSAALPCWRLDFCNPVFVIKTIGSYEIDVTDGADDIVITCTMSPLQLTNKIADAPCQCEDS